METRQFDALVRILGNASARRLARRSIVGSGIVVALGPLLGSHASAAKKKRGKPRKQRTSRCARNCAERACGNDGCGGSCGACAANQVCQGGSCCVPESRGATCAGRCGTWTNNCGQSVVCASCPTGQTCLSNGTCAIACTSNGECGACGCSNPSVEGERHCIAGPMNPMTSCSVTGDCPPGAHCQDIGARLCIEICN